MNPSPFLGYVDVDYIRGLGGEPKVTYPSGDTAYPVTERIKGGFRDRATLTFLSAEPDASRFPSLVLTQQIELKSDGINVEMYYRYERVPGPVIGPTSVYDPASGRSVMVTRQTVLTSGVPTTADALDSEINGYGTAKVVFSLVSGLVGCTAHGFAIGDEIFFPSPLALNHLSLTGVATTAGWPIITCASTAGFHMGSLLAGTGIQAGSSILRILSSTSLEMTYAATSTNSGLTLTSSELGMTIGNTAGAGAYYVSSIPNANSFYFTDMWGGTPNIYPTASGGGFVFKRTTPRGTTISYAPLGDSTILSTRTVTTVPLLAMDFLHGAPDEDIPGNHDYRWPDVLNTADFYAVAAAWGSGYAGDIALKLGITEGPEGKSKALIRRRYTSNPQAPGFLDSIPPIQRWFKSAQTLVGEYAFVEGNSPRAGARTFTIPATIHPAGSANIVGDASLYTLLGQLDTNLAGSYPPAIPEGWIVADVVPQKVEHGLTLYLIILVRLF